MARKSKSQHSSGLLNALSFVGMNGANYCQIGRKFITSITDNICLGHPIDEELECQANIKAFSQSLTRATDQVTITQLDIDKLHVGSNGMEVYVNCEKEIKHVTPDPKMVQCDSNLVNSFANLYPIVLATGDCTSVKTVLLYGQSCFATNRHILVESWHGIELPYCNISKKFVDVVLKSKKEIEYFGYSDSSVTVYFKDGSWIMGRQEKEAWINPFDILNVPTEGKVVDEAFKTSLKAVLGFAGSTAVVCSNGRLQSHAVAEQGAVAGTGGLPEGFAYGVKEMKFLLDHGISLDQTNPQRLYFFGDKIRGCISARVN